MEERFGDRLGEVETKCAEIDGMKETVEELSDYTSGTMRFADFAGRVAYDAEGKEIFNFGKYKGLRVADVFRRDPGYHGWIQQGDFPQYTKAVFMRVYLSLRG